LSKDDTCSGDDPGPTLESVTTRREPKGEGEDTDWQERLAGAMDARGLSGGELARRAGFTSQYVNSLRSGDRGARLPIDTARKLAAALGVSVEWLTRGDGPRERLSDVFVVGSGAEGAGERPSALPDVYPGRAEAIALLQKFVAPEVIDAMRAAVAEDGVDPDRDYWIAYAKELARDLRRIEHDPDLGGRRSDRDRDAPPKSAYVPAAKKK
jgi:transcriptional regulator with XRE-family HTH domain